jgi:hypothetical protein
MYFEERGILSVRGRENPRRISVEKHPVGILTVYLSSNLLDQTLLNLNSCLEVFVMLEVDISSPRENGCDLDSGGAVGDVGPLDFREQY